MSNQIIDKALAYLGNLKTVADIKYAKGTTGTGISLNANTGCNVVGEGYCTSVTVPEGYTMLLYGVHTSGSSAVVAVGVNTYWVQNTSNASATFSATPWAIFVKTN